MAIPKPQKPSAAQVLKLAEQLSIKERNKLRDAFLEELEDQEDIRIAEERLKHPGQRWSHQEIKQQIDLAD
jgi:hypothetical protein